MGNYDDIIDLPHHVSATRPGMSVADRAAQFSSFAALTGHSAAIVETARLTDKQASLSEDAMDTLTFKLNMLAEILHEKPTITVTYFIPDKKKEGGSYACLSGTLGKIDNLEAKLIFCDKREIAFDDIVEIESEYFNAKFRE